MDNFNYNIIEPGYYDEIIDQNNIRSNWHKNKFEFVKSKLIGNNVLDIGCGPGTFLGRYCQNFKSTGYDLIDSQINFAKKKYSNIKFVNNLDHIENQNFNNITLIELVEHLNKNYTIELLNSLKKFLNKDSQIIITTPNYRSLWPILEILLDYKSKMNYRKQHIQHFNINKIHNLASKIDLELVESGTLNAIDPFLIFKTQFEKSSIYEKFINKIKLGFLCYGIFKKKY